MLISAPGAHPDDLEIFMYGCLAAMKARGDHPTLIVATYGAQGGVNPEVVLARKEPRNSPNLTKLGTPQLLDLPGGGRYP